MCSAKDCFSTAIPHPLFKCTTYLLNAPLHIWYYLVYLDEICSLRFSLLYEVFEKQLCSVQITSQTTKIYENVLFLYHVLEYRFVEEMAALRKCLVIRGDKCKTTANKLAILLYRRADWMIEKYKLWSKAVVSPIEKKFEVSPNLVQIAVSTRVQIAALLISLQSIFIVCLSDYKTVHPISQSNIDILVEWQSFNIKFLNGPKTFMIDKMKEYYDTLRIMGIEYLTDFLEHCISTWSVPHLCCNPTQDVELLSLQHAEKIYSALLQFSLLCSYDLLTNNISSGMKLILNISHKLVKAEVLLRSAGVDSSVDWNDTYNKVKVIFEDIICTLHLVEDISISFTEKPSWRGCNDIYLSLFRSFISLERDGLKCLHINEFLENSLKWGSKEEEEKTDQKNLEENSKSESEKKHYHKVRKLTKIICSKHNVSKTLVIKKTVVKSVKHSKNCPLAPKSGDEREKNINCSHLENSSAEMKRLKRKAKKEGKVEETVNDKDISHEKCEAKDDKTTDTHEDRNVSAVTTGEKIVKKKKKSKLPCLENKRELPHIHLVKGTLSKEHLVGKKEVSNDKKSIEHRRRKLQQNKVDKLLSSPIIDSKVKSNLEDCTPMTDVQIIKDCDKDTTRAEKDQTKVTSSKVVKDKIDYIEATLLRNNKQELIKIKPEEVTKERGEHQSPITNVEDMINKPEGEIVTAGKILLESVTAGTSFLKLWTEIACDAKLTNRGETEENCVKATSNNSTVFDNEKQNVEKYEKEDDDSGQTKGGEKNLHSQNLKSCFNCGVTEAVRRTFKKCSLCEKYKWKVKRFYCSPECQAKDWKALHCQEHKIGVVQ